MAVAAIATRIRGAAQWEASGLAYASLSGFSLAYLRDDNHSGLIAILFLFAVVWATDTGALFAGRAIGGPKLAPTVSPNKTWSGFFGGLVAALAVSLIAALWYGAAALLPIILAGAVLSVVSQLGDLLESRVKRYLHVKDSGSIIPGHGGLFDRVDGLLAAAPVLAAIYVVIGGGSVLWR